MTARLPHVTRVAPRGHWPAGETVATVTLAYADRNLRRRRLAADDGTAVLLDLPRPRLLADGDGLDLGDGRWIAARAAAEPVIEARAGSSAALARLAWHVGNRHTPAQVLAGALRLQDDPVLADMLAGLGAEIVRTTAPFEPEPGAYVRHGPGDPHHHHADAPGDGTEARS